MTTLLGRNRKVKAAAMTALFIVLAGQAMPVLAQDTLAETRVRKMEAEIRALQRQVFPGSDGKVFSPEITQQTGISTPASGQPATTPVTDILVRLDTLEGQIARLTAQSEQNANKISQIEAQLASAAPAAAAVAAPAAAAATTSAPALLLPSATTSAQVASAATPKPPVAAATVAPAPARPVAKPAATPVAPSAQRVAAVRAIVKPQTDDPADDEYSYGFRLWEAKFYPEAQQQLKLMVDKYPRHARISFARNLLGRAYLDDNKPREAAQWFLQNYNANKAGERASDSLLFLAEAMRRLGDTSRACIALAEFNDTYVRDAAGRLKTQYDRTRSTLTCN